MARIRLCASLTLAVLLAGCAGTLPRTPPSTVDELTRHAERHRGQLIASGGPLIALHPDGDRIVLRIATPNYGHIFDVRMPLPASHLSLGEEISFVGRLDGVAPSRESYSGNILLIEGIAVKPVGSAPLFAEGSGSIGESWLKGDLDLMESASTRAASPSVGEPPQPRPSGASVTRAAPAASSAGVQKLLEAFSRLSPAEQADFLRRVGSGPVGQ